MELDTNEYKFFYDSVRNGINYLYDPLSNDTTYTFFDNIYGNYERNKIQITTNTKTFLLMAV